MSEHDDKLMRAVKAARIGYSSKAFEEFQVSCEGFIVTYFSIIALLAILTAPLWGWELIQYFTEH